jgi:hypothetical protein
LEMAVENRKVIKISLEQWKLKCEPVNQSIKV